MEKVILFCGSSGGVAVFEEMLKGLGSLSKASIVAVFHRASTPDDLLVQRLDRITKMKIKVAAHGIQMEPGYVYIASGGYHLLLEPDFTFALDSGEPVHYCRPAADVSLESFSWVLKDKLIAIIVSGANSDGGLGAKVVHKRGGKIIIQDPEDAHFPQMPDSAVFHVGEHSRILKQNEISKYLLEKVGI